MPPEGDPPPAVTVPGAVADAILTHAAAAAPREACGLLVGRDAVVQRAVAARNVALEPTRFEVAAEDHFAAVRAARSEGLEVIGAYHSHPASPAVPSPTDRDAAFGGFLFVIASPVPQPHLRAWELRHGNFVERPLVRT
jgi:proteasome lid subunit RPN8/RPN11